MDITDRMMAAGSSGIKAITCCWAALIIATGLVYAQTFPSVEIGISDEIVEPGLEATLSCRVQNQGSFRVTIQKEMKIGEEKYIDILAMDDTVVEKYAKTGRFSIRKLTIAKNGLYILDMLNVTQEDSATYVCKVTGTSQKDEAKFAVYKQASLVEFDNFQPGDIITFTEGISRSVRCRAAESFPPANLTLRVGDKVRRNTLVLSQEHIAKCYSPSSSASSDCLLHTYFDTEASLSELITTPEDDGKMLSCEARLRNSKQNPVTTQIEISVLYSPKISCERNHSASLGSETQVTCTVESNPAPMSIIWRYIGDPVVHGNITIKSSYKVENTQNIYSVTKTNSSKEHTVTLHIPEVMPHHFTTFTLDVANIVGSSSAQILLFKDGPDELVNGGDSSGVPFYAPVIIVLSVLSIMCISCCKR